MKKAEIVLLGNFEFRVKTLDRIPDQGAASSWRPELDDRRQKVFSKSADRIDGEKLEFPLVNFKIEATLAMAKRV